MLTDAFDTLLALAEVAVALAGFSAIVVVLKRGSEGKWQTRHADQFHGMVIHAIFAVVFCLLPNFLNFVIQDVVTTLHVACAVLGVQIIAHAVGVMTFETTSAASKMTLGFGLLVGLAQFTVFTTWGVMRELDIYSLGIMWHILQAGVLFVMLVWIPKSDITHE